MRVKISWGEIFNSTLWTWCYQLFFPFLHYDTQPDHNGGLLKSRTHLEIPSHMALSKIRSCRITLLSLSTIVLSVPYMIYIAWTMSCGHVLATSLKWILFGFALPIVVSISHNAHIVRYCFRHRQFRYNLWQLLYCAGIIKQLIVWQLEEKRQRPMLYLPPSLGIFWLTKSQKWISIFKII